MEYCAHAQTTVALGNEVQSFCKLSVVSWLIPVWAITFSALSATTSKMDLIFSHSPVLNPNLIVNLLVSKSMDIFTYTKYFLCPCLDLFSFVVHHPYIISSLHNYMYLCSLFVLHISVYSMPPWCYMNLWTGNKAKVKAGNMAHLTLPGILSRAVPVLCSSLLRMMRRIHSHLFEVAS